MFSKYSLEFKLAGIMVVALVISSVLSNTVFLANTPRINKPFLAKVVAFPGSIIKNTSNYIASLQSPISNLQIPNNDQNSNIQKNNKTMELSNNSASRSVNQSQRVSTITPTPIFPAILRQLSQGVFAEEDTKNKVIYIKVTSNDPWEERQLIVNGQTVTIRAPIGTWK
jgi:hypothetical protein